MSSTSGSDHARLCARLLLGAVLVVLSVRLVGFAIQFGKQSLQMDLAAYYTAGQSVEAGLSPYVNHVSHRPPIWDGVNVYRHSRFLYPPLAAEGFRLLTIVPYRAAKFLWMVLTLIALAAAMVLAVRLSRMETTPERLLVLGVVATWFYPLLTLLERGQLDGFTLLLVLGALALMDRHTPRRSLAAGTLFALATLLKLSCAFFVPFLLIRRRWRVVGGFALGAVALVGVDLVVDGPARVRGYLVRELPRISEFGERGTRDMQLPRETFRPVMSGLEQGQAPMDGRVYATSSFRFVLNGAVPQGRIGRQVREAVEHLVGRRPALSHLACALVGGFLALFYFRQRRCGLDPAGHWGAGELVYWQGVMAVILLSGPVTWAMNAVWLLPLVPILLRRTTRLSSAPIALSVTACTLGLLLVGAPDPYGFSMLSPFGVRVLDGKYVVGELICLVGLLGLWRGDRVTPSIR